MHSWICKVYAKFVFGFEGAAIGCSPECNELQERRKRHHTFFLRKDLQVNSANDFERSVAARAVSPFAWFMEPRSSCKFFLQKKCGASFCWLAISIMDLHLATQILTGHDSSDYYMQACIDDTFCPLYHHMISMIILFSLRT